MLTEASWSWSLGFCFNRATHNVIFIRFWSCHLYSDRLPNTNRPKKDFTTHVFFSRLPWGTCCSVKYSDRLPNTSRPKKDFTPHVFFLFPRGTCCSVHIGCIVDSRAQGVVSVDWCVVVSLTVQPQVDSALTSFTWCSQRWSECGRIVDCLASGGLSVDQCVVVSLTALPQVNSALISVWFRQPQLTVVYLVKSALIGVWLYRWVFYMLKSALTSV